MTAQSKTVIKSYFETGDKPTSAQFSDFIDSYQDAANNLGVLTSAGLGVVGLQLLGCNTSASAQSIIGGGGATTVSAGAVTFNNSNRILGNVSAGVGTELSSTDFLFSGTTINLNPTTVSAGTYASPTVTIDSKGRITSAIAGAGGSGELILLGTATASSSAEIDFISLITSTYDYYFFILKELKTSVNNGTIAIQSSSNNGSTWNTGSCSTNLSSHALSATTITVTAQSGTNTAIIGTNGSGVVCELNGKIEVVNPIGAFNCPVFWNVIDNSSALFFEGYGEIGQSVNAIRFVPSSGNIASGIIEMYGVKNT